MLSIIQSPTNPLAFHVDGCPEPDSTHPALKRFFTVERHKPMTDNHRIRRAAEYNAMRNTLVRAEFLDTEPGEWIRALPAMPFIGGYSLVPDHHPLIVQFTDPKVAAMFKLTWA